MLEIDNWTEAKDALRGWRENNDRRSEDILYLWKAFLEYNLNKLGNEKPLVLEQVCLAALDRHNYPVVEFCIKSLSREFPKSLRVQKYIAMLCEAQEDYEEALHILDSIIKEDETNSAPRKRKIAILKAQGKYPEAIKELADYLKIFMADIEAWQELGELYVAEQDFPKAAFCIEELILHNPHNHLLHQRYADIRYTQGGFENMELARAYYCQALKLNPNNLRALYGLYLASSNMACSQKCTVQKKAESKKMADWALKKVEEIYANAKDDLGSLDWRFEALKL